MIKGPWPLAPDGTRHIIPLDPPFLTPLLAGERAALRVSEADDEKASPRGPGEKGVITDLDTGAQYRLIGADCGSGRCYCDAEIIPLSIGDATIDRLIRDHAQRLEELEAMPPDAVIPCDICAGNAPEDEFHGCGGIMTVAQAIREHETEIEILEKSRISARVRPPSAGRRRR